MKHWEIEREERIANYDGPMKISNWWRKKGIISEIAKLKIKREQNQKKDIRKETKSKEP